MSSVHMGPEDAVRAHHTLGAGTSIAIHHGTFQLGDEGLDTPRKRLSECAPRDSFLVLDNGQSVTLPPLGTPMIAGSVEATHNVYLFQPDDVPGQAGRDYRRGVL